MEARRGAHVGALLTGCAPGGGTSPAPTPRDSSPISGDTGTGDSPGSQGCSGAEAPDFSVKPAPSALQWVTYNSVREIPGPGIYVIDLPQVQKPPFADPYLLKVQDAKGECLNLRESFSRSSRVIRCLSTGTKLAVADLAQAPIKLNQAFYYNDEQIWLWARTEGGETGWVSLSSGSVTWAQ